MNKLTIELPKGFMNIAVTNTNHLIADTNDSENWGTIKIPLPTMIYDKWVINKINGKFVELVSYL